jgi:hypothetical protein
VNAILERIKEAYHLETDAEVADFLDIKPSTLSMQKNRGRLDLKRIIKRCRDLNKNWLLEGKGKKRARNGANYQAPTPFYTSLEISNCKPDFENSPKAGDIYTDISNEVSGCSNSNRLIGFVNSEDGMSPTIEENDIAVINLDGEPAHNAIFLIALSNRASLRRLHREQDKLIAQSRNGRDDHIQISVSESRQCIGELVWVLRRV